MSFFTEVPVRIAEFSANLSTESTKTLQNLSKTSKNILKPKKSEQILKIRQPGPELLHEGHTKAREGNVDSAVTHPPPPWGWPTWRKAYEIK